MLNFTVGPVDSYEEIRKIGYEQVPYFRTEEFSKLMLENESLINKFVNAESGARSVFLTGSGTASMEATVMNVFTKDDKVLIVNGGSFGERFAKICEIHDIPYTEIKIKLGKNITKEDLEKYQNGTYTAFLVNMHETSTGVLYDMNLISDFCNKNNLFLVVDTISSFLADEFDMSKLGVDVTIMASQKALACPPGISIITLSKRAIERINKNNVKSFYFDLKSALQNGERGQTPFTPAVGILRQINARLNNIKSNGGVEKEIERVKNVALDFRNRIKDFPFEIVSESLSNAVTPLKTKTASAHKIFLILKDEYNIWVCPNGGELKDIVFRVGHIGALTKDENTKLIEALLDMKKRNLL